MVENFFYVDGVYKEDELRRILERKNTAILGGVRHTIKRRLVMKVSNLSGKVIVLEELEIPKEVEKETKKFYRHTRVIYHWIPRELRIGYYIINRNGKWTWSQFSLMLPAEDLANLIEKAKKHNFIK